MGQHSRRMILPPTCDRARAEATILAAGASAPLVRTGARDHYPAGDGLVVVLDEDPLVRRLFVQVAGEDAGRREALAARLGRDLGAWSPEALLRHHDDQTGETSRATALRMLGLGAPATPDDDFTKRIAAGLDDPRTSVREAALQAAARYAVPGFAARLSEIADTDPDPGLREIARTTLTRYAESGLT